MRSKSFIFSQGFKVLQTLAGKVCVECHKTRAAEVVGSDALEPPTDQTEGEEIDGLQEAGDVFDKLGAQAAKARR